MSSQDPHVGAPGTNVIAFGGGAFGKELGSDELVRWSPRLIRKIRDQSRPPWKATARTWPCTSQEEGSPQTNPAGPLILEKTCFSCPVYSVFAMQPELSHELNQVDARMKSKQSVLMTSTGLELHFS